MKALLVGGCTAWAAFAVIGGCAVLTGGSPQIDIGGAICLFVFGGLIGILVVAIRGR